MVHLKDQARRAMFAKLKNGDKIIYDGKHTVLNLKLPEDRTGQGTSVIYPVPENEKITYVVSKSDKDGHLFFHWENQKGQSIAFDGRLFKTQQLDLSRRTSAFAFRTDYRNGLQFNKNPADFGDSVRVPTASEIKKFKEEFSTQMV